MAEVRFERRCLATEFLFLATIPTNFFRVKQGSIFFFFNAFVMMEIFKHKSSENPLYPALGCNKYQHPTVVNKEVFNLYFPKVATKKYFCCPFWSCLSHWLNLGSFLWFPCTIMKTAGSYFCPVLSQWHSGCYFAQFNQYMDFVIPLNFQGAF